MGLNVLGVVWSAAESLGGVLMEEPSAQVLGIWGQEVIIELWLGIFDVLVELFPVLGVEGRQANEHFVNNRAEGPPVGRLTMALPLKHLWGEVFSGTTEGLGVLLSLDAHLGEAEVSQLNVALFVDEHILWFETRRTLC